MSTKQHIIFDLDGTLIDSKPEIISTYKKVFEEIVPPHLIEYEEINYGNTLTAILEKVYNQNSTLIEKAKLLFSEIYDHSNYEKTLLYSDVFEILHQFHSKEFILHIATNKRLQPTVNILKSKGIFHLFTCVVTNDLIKDKPMSKTDMVELICQQQLVSKGFMIGDSSQDIQAGNAANLETIAVLYGYEKKEELLRNNPKFVINQFKELNTIILK
jgi:phosphoglycolate phosphatase